MKCITLVENSSHDQRLGEEFGLSLLVKCHSGTILFDTGASSLFTQNGAVLGIDFHDVDCAVVSHAHYDHGGGLGAFLEVNARAPVYIGREAGGSYWGNAGAKLPLFLEPLVHPLICRNPRYCRYVGLDREVLDSGAKRIKQVEKKEEILEDVFLLTDICGEDPPAEGNKYLLKGEKDALRPDDFTHELIMVVRETDGIVLFTGCGHRGITNMVRTVQGAFPEERLKAVVGGFHLALQPGRPKAAGGREYVVSIAEELVQRGVEKIVTGHCTGMEACEVLSECFGERFERLSTGTVHDL